MHSRGDVILLIVDRLILTPPLSALSKLISPTSSGSCRLNRHLDPQQLKKRNGLVRVHYCPLRTLRYLHLGPLVHLSRRDPSCHPFR